MVENFNGNGRWMPKSRNERLGEKQIGFINSYVGRMYGNGDLTVLNRATGKVEIVCSLNPGTTRRELRRILGKKQ